MILVAQTKASFSNLLLLLTSLETSTNIPTGFSQTSKPTTQTEQGNLQPECFCLTLSCWRRFGAA